MNPYNRNFPVNTAGSRTITIPAGLRWVTIQNASSYAVGLYTGNSTDVADRFAYASQFAYVTQYLPKNTSDVTVQWTGGAGADQFSLLFSEVSLGINQTLLAPGGTANVVVAGDTVGLARQAQLPAALVAGRLSVQLGADGVGLAKDGTEQTGVVPPAGVSGMRGWLSAIWQLLSTGAAWVMTRKNPYAIVFQNAAVAPATGAVLTVAGLETVTFEVYGTSASQTVTFEGAGPSGTFRSVSAVRLDTMATALQTIGTGELWQADVRGLVSFRCNLTAVAGGNVTVSGVAV